MYGAVVFGDVSLEKRGLGILELVGGNAEEHMTACGVGFEDLSYTAIVRVSYISACCLAIHWWLS